MSRAAVLALAAVAATGCGDDGAESVPTPVPGTWAITWTCVEGCAEGNVNPLRYDDTLVISDAEARYQSSACQDCEAVHAGSADGLCLAVAAGEDFGVTREAYQLCAFDGVLGADLVFSGFPGPAEPRTWHLDGEPQ